MLLCQGRHAPCFPPPPTPSTIEIHQEHRLELEPKPVVDRGCWGCKAARNGSHEPLASYALIFSVGAECGEPALVLGRCEWWKGGTHTAGQQIIQTQECCHLPLCNQVLLCHTRVESIWKVCHSAVTTPFLHPSVDNQELTLIHRRTVKTLLTPTTMLHRWGRVHT